MIRLFIITFTLTRDNKTGYSVNGCLLLLLTVWWCVACFATSHIYHDMIVNYHVYEAGKKNIFMRTFAKNGSRCIQTHLELNFCAITVSGIVFILLYFPLRVRDSPYFFHIASVLCENTFKLNSFHYHWTVCTILKEEYMLKFHLFPF